TKSRTVKFCARGAAAILSEEVCGAVAGTFDAARWFDVEARCSACASTWTAAASAKIKTTRIRRSETSISTAVALGATTMMNLPCSLGYTAHALVRGGTVT